MRQWPPLTTSRQQLDKTCVLFQTVGTSKKCNGCIIQQEHKSIGGFHTTTLQLGQNCLQHQPQQAAFQMTWLHAQPAVLLSTACVQPASGRKSSTPLQTPCCQAWQGSGSHLVTEKNCLIVQRLGHGTHRRPNYNSSALATLDKLDTLDRLSTSRLTFCSATPCLTASAAAASSSVPAAPGGDCVMLKAGCQLCSALLIRDPTLRCSSAACTCCNSSMPAYTARMSVQAGTTEQAGSSTVTAVVVELVLGPVRGRIGTQFVMPGMHAKHVHPAPPRPSTERMPVAQQLQHRRKHRRAKCRPSTPHCSPVARMPSYSACQLSASFLTSRPSWVVSIGAHTLKHKFTAEREWGEYMEHGLRTLQTKLLSKPQRTGT